MATQQELEDDLGRFGQTALRIKAERDRFQMALELIASGYAKPEEIARIALKQ